MRLTKEQKFWNFEKLITMLYGQRGEGVKECDTDLAGMVKLCNGNHIQTSPLFTATVQGKEANKNRTLFGSVNELFNAVTGYTEGKIGAYQYNVTYGNDGRDEREISCYTMCISVSSMPEIYHMDMEEAAEYILKKYPVLMNVKPNYIIRIGNSGIQILYIFAQNIAVCRKSFAYLQKAFARMFAEYEEEKIQMRADVCLPYSRGKDGHEPDIVFCNGRVYDYHIFRKELLNIFDHSSISNDREVCFPAVDGECRYDTWLRENQGKIPRDDLSASRKDKDDKNKRGGSGSRGRYNKDPRVSSCAAKKWISNRMCDLDKVLEMRNGDMTGYRTSYLYTYGYSFAWHKPDNASIEKAIRDRNQMFTKPLEEEYVDVVIGNVLTHYYFRIRTERGIRPDSDKKMRIRLGLTDEEVSQLSNVYLSKEEKDALRRKMRAVGIQQRKEKTKLCRCKKMAKLMLLVRKFHDTAKAVRKSGIPKTSAYRLLKTYNSLFVSIAGRGVETFLRKFAELFSGEDVQPVPIPKIEDGNRPGWYYNAIWHLQKYHEYITAV